MEIRVDTAAATPVFAQIVDAVEVGTARGAIPVGERLPTVRGLADDLGVAPGTVAKAYRELESRGVIETRGRQGSFIRSRDEHRDGVARLAAVEYLRTTAALGLSAAEARRLLDDAIDS